MARLTSSPRPKARPNKVTSSPRPKPRPTTGSAKPNASSTRAGGFFSGNEKGFSRSSGGGKPTPNTSRSAPKPEAPKARPKVKPDNSLLLNRQGAQRGNTQSAGGGAPNRIMLSGDSAKHAVRSLQSFNGPRGQKLKLGQ